MKSLYESLLTGKVPKPSAKVVPGSKEELQQLVSEHIKKIKPRPGQEVDLDWIDISDVDDLSGLFLLTEYIPVIDTWKIDRVKNFYYMFVHNKYIVRSPLPRLQEKLLGRGCYNSMFYGCTSLEEPPVLPAKTLAPNCYSDMFSGCTALKAAPQLPATKLTEYCYACMFWGCSSLVDPPVLPAKILAPHCYTAMFEKCVNLKTKAKMPPGVNLDGSTAQGMYARCPCKNK